MESNQSLELPYLLLKQLTLYIHHNRKRRQNHRSSSAYITLSVLQSTVISTYKCTEVMISKKQVVKEVKVIGGRGQDLKEGGKA